MDKTEEFKRNMAMAVTSTLESGLKRMKTIRDPMTRHTVCLDRILILFDVIIGSMKVGLASLPPDLLVKSEAVLLEYQKEMESLLDWIQQPAYSPDHIVGASIMNDAQTSFEQDAQIQKIKKSIAEGTMNMDNSIKHTPTSTLGLEGYDRKST